MSPIQPLHLAFALVLAVGVSLAAYRVRALTNSGAVSAALVGGVIFGIGGGLWAAALLTFFVTSSLLSRWRKRAKDALAFEKTGRRDAGQVWANGGVAAVCALLPLFHVPTGLAHLLFLAALAAANADTWATEIGAAMGGTPRLITTGRRVPRGTSGGVSGFGTLGALLGAGLLGAFAGTPGEVLAVTLAGWGASLMDSLLGATVQAQWRDAAGGLTERPQPGAPDHGRRWVNNDFVNAVCTATAPLLLVVCRLAVFHAH